MLLTRPECRLVIVSALNIIAFSKNNGNRKGKSKGKENTIVVTRAHSKHINTRYTLVQGVYRKRAVGARLGG